MVKKSKKQIRASGENMRAWSNSEEGKKKHAETLKKRRLFSDSQIIDIREKIGNGDAKTVVAREFNVSVNTITRIVNRISYTDV